MHLKSDRVLRVVCSMVMSSQELMLIFMTSNLSMLTFNQTYFAISTIFVASV